MNTKTTIIVLLIAAALGVYFFVFERGQTSEDRAITAQPGSGTPVFDANSLRPADVRKLTLELPGKPAIVIERNSADAAKWIQTAPVRIAVNDWEINDLIDEASLLRYINTLKIENLADYGLDPAKMTMTLEGQTAEGGSFTHVLKFGRTTAAGQGLLMINDHERIYAVEAELHKQFLKRDPMLLRSTTLGEISLSNVKKLTLQRDDWEVAVVQEAGQWRFEAGATGRANPEKMQSLVETINFAVIDSFAADNPDNLERFGLAEPKFTLQLEVEKPTAADAEEQPADPAAPVTHTLRIGGATDLSESKYFATYEPDAAGTVLVINKEAISRLSVGLDDLRDPRLTPMLATDIREITVEQSTGDPDAAELHFVRDEGRWTFADPKPAFDIEPNAVNQLIDALLQTRAVAYVEIQQPEIEGETDTDQAQEKTDAAPPPLAVVRVAVARETENETLSITQHAEGRLLVQRNDETTGYIVNSADLAMLFEPLIAYRNRTVWDLQVDQIIALKLNRMGEYPAGYQLTRTVDGQWNLTGMDSAAVDQLIAVITPLRVSRWGGDASRMNPDVQLTVSLADSTTRTLKVASNSNVALTDEGAFEPELAMIVAMSAELRNRKLIDAAYDELARVQRGELVVQRDPDGLYTIAGDESFDEPRAAQLFDTLAALAAAHFVSDDWAKIDPLSPTATLQIALHDGTTFTMQLWSPQATGRGEPMGRIDAGPLFTLNRFDYQILVGEPFGEAGPPTEPVE